MSTATAAATEAEEWISRADAAELARCHEATIIRDVKQHGLKTTSGPGGRVMVRLADLIRIGRTRPSRRESRPSSSSSTRPGAACVSCPN